MEIKIDIKVKEGTHSTAAEITKQINDKERVAAALENPNLLKVVDECIKESDYWIEMEEIDSFTERNVKQPTLRSCINTNDSKGNNVPLLDNTTLASGDATNVDQYNSSYNKLNTEISKNGNSEGKNVEENY